MQSVRRLLMEDEIYEIDRVVNGMWSMARNSEITEVVLRVELGILAERLREVQKRLTKRAADGGKSARKTTNPRSKKAGATRRR